MTGLHKVADPLNIIPDKGPIAALHPLTQKPPEPPPTAEPPEPPDPPPVVAMPDPGDARKRALRERSKAQSGTIMGQALGSGYWR